MSYLSFIVVTSFLVIVIFYKIYEISLLKNINSTLQSTVLQLREKYNMMMKNNRSKIDICDNKEKLGSNREYESSTGNNCEPWISRECIFILDKIIPTDGTGLEWSSGSSTLWLVYRLKSLISIENNKKWYKIVKKVINYRNLQNNAKIYFIGNDKLNYCKNKTEYISKFNYEDICFRTYVTTKFIPNKKYDFISIDGRARTGCILRSIELIKPENGIIMVDNSERERYKWVYNKVPKKWNIFDFEYDNGIVRLYITHK